ncbi:MAG: hypothetical protein IT290_03740, partial [Deltaproteobacteria bacterium]|nr:hypothetical protein [Deltaproteobacteria bacterium]
RALAPQAIIIATADDDAHEQELIREGAQIVIRPFDLAGLHVIEELNSVLTTTATSAFPGVTETLARRWTWSEQEALLRKSQND